MNKKYVLIMAVLSTTWLQLAIADQSTRSQYSGQETRTIKSLSPEDIVELERGGGWGLAKVAELNGLPGPAHLLELKNEIGLTGEQLTKIQVIHDEMKSQAIEFGKKLIQLEEALEALFQSRVPTETDLKNLLTDIAQTRSQLRFIHLSAHLKTPRILTAKQIETYNQLRGYDSTDPCINIPEGHDATMWRKHNQCG